jgi:hypothetical protein
MNNKVQITKALMPSLLVFALWACGGGGNSNIDAAVHDAAPGNADAAPDDTPTGGSTVGTDESTFNHPNSAQDIYDIIDRLLNEGPAYYNARVHGCPKVKYTTMGNILASRGVDLNAAGETQAGNMWAQSDQALGAPNYSARARENAKLTTASAAKLFDIFVQAAPEIIAAMPTLPACTVGGQPTEMFNANGNCTIDGISCLIGTPATLGHVDLCNNVVNQASTPEKGQHIAVATLLAAANTCE